MRHLLAPALVLVLLVGGVPVGLVAVAQERSDATTIEMSGTVTELVSLDPADCPEGLVCVEIDEAVVEVDPACGPVVGVIVSESLARTIDFDGVRESTGVRGVVLIATDDGGYTVAGEFAGPAVNALAGTAFGDIGCLAWGEVDG